MFSTPLTSRPGSSSNHQAITSLLAQSSSEIIDPSAKYSLLFNSIIFELHYCGVCAVLFDLTVLGCTGWSRRIWIFFFKFIIGPFDRMSRDQIKSIRADVEEYCSALCCALIVYANLALSVLSGSP